MRLPLTSKARDVIKGRIPTARAGCDRGRRDATNLERNLYLVTQLWNTVVLSRRADDDVSGADAQNLRL